LFFKNVECWYGRKELRYITIYINFGKHLPNLLASGKRKPKFLKSLVRVYRITFHYEGCKRCVNEQKLRYAFTEVFFQG
jgi:hypothetical protein